MAALAREVTRAARSRKSGRGDAPSEKAAQNEFNRVVDAYFDHAPPEPFNAAQWARRVARNQAEAGLPPLASTPGERAARFQAAQARERSELEAWSPDALERSTRLRDALSYNNDLRPFVERAAMLRAAREIKGLRTFHNAKPHRIAVCLRSMTKGGPTDAEGARCVSVVGSGEAPPRYRGVVVCGNGWLCPVCAPRITEGRRLELREGVGAHRAAGGAVVLMTFTFSHGPGEALADQWAALGKALQGFVRSGAVKRFRDALGWRGRIRAREITFGLNGWHPHAHTLELFDGALCTEETLDAWHNELAGAWRAACTMANLDASIAHGFRASLTDVDTYISKWGVDAELTKWHLKRGRIDPDAPDESRLFGYTPFDLLRCAAGELTAHARLKLTPERAEALFTEYAHAVHGTAQLHWTRGLKAELGLGECSDDELAARDDPDETTLGELTAGEWNAITFGHHQVEFLGIVHVAGWDSARFFLERWVTELEQWRERTARVAARNRGIAWMFRQGP